MKHSAHDGNVLLVYADEYTDTLPSMEGLATYYCLDCLYEWQAADAESCPSCGSADVYKS